MLLPICCFAAAGLLRTVGQARGVETVAARRSLVRRRRQVGPAGRNLTKSLVATLEDRVIAMLEVIIVLEDAALLTGYSYLTLTRGETV